ncbi:MAG TPA: VOC family protein [Thermoanaerobaculia bacterium]|nr:VOC family protein [Thermoanaerobaculia bacterium]
MNIHCEQHHAGIAVTDVATAVEYYTTKLGFSLGFTHGHDFAAVNLGEVQIFLQRGTPNTSASSAYFLVDDADALFEFHRANGVAIAQEIEDRDYGLRDYAVRDADGNYLAFGHRLHDTGPKIPIERVDVPLRLEKRLAALLHNLATHKKMSLASCVEEILLHTNEGVGPHTKHTLAHIQELKRKHGIDYDSHGSYRFFEE